MKADQKLIQMKQNAVHLYEREYGDNACTLNIGN